VKERIDRSLRDKRMNQTKRQRGKIMEIKRKDKERHIYCRTGRNRKFYREIRMREGLRGMRD
jgi:hypothetical protein